MAVGRQCGAGLLMQGLICRDLFEDSGLGPKSCLRRRERYYLAACTFQPGGSYFPAPHQLPWLRQPPPLPALLALSVVAAAAFSLGSISASTPTDGHLCASICRLLTASVISTQSAAVFAAIIQLSHFSSSPDAQGRICISGVVGGGGSHGLAAMGHHSAAVLAVGITAVGAGLFRTSPFPARLLCSSDLSEITDYFFPPSSSFSSPPKAGDDLNIVFKGLW